MTLQSFSRIAVPWLAFGLLASVAAAPASTCPTGGQASAVPSDDTLEQLGAIVGEITIRVLDIFDTDIAEENNRVFRLANRLHINTRESVIRSQLLFESGDPYQKRLLDESERVLRSTRYLDDAEVRPIRLCDHTVDIEVWARDVWTLTATGGFSRDGGENAQRIELAETNLFGTGKDATIQWTSDVDRDSFLVRYRDPLLAGTRTRLLAWYADNSDGEKKRLDVVRPFFSLDSRWSAGVLTLAEKRVDHLYSRGQVVDQFAHRVDGVEVFGGRSPGLRNGRTQRVTTGFTFEHHRFAPDPGVVPTTLPPERRLAYPWLGFEWLGDAFIEAHDFDLIGRTEDLFVGTRFGARVGWSSSAFGGDRSRLIFSSHVIRGYRTGRRQLLFLSAGVGGRHGTDGFEDLLVGGSGRFYLRNLGRHQFVGRISLDVARNLDPEDQLLLGGDSGLRGYPLRYQEGTRRFLLTLEQRFYRQRQLFHLLYVGGAVFLDVGRAWFDQEATRSGRGLLGDVGFGLRLSPSRSSRGTMVHVDLAFPLNGDPAIESVQWLINARESF